MISLSIVLDVTCGGIAVVCCGPLHAVKAALFSGCSALGSLGIHTNYGWEGGIRPLGPQFLHLIDGR